MSGGAAAPSTAITIGEPSADAAARAPAAPSAPPAPAQKARFAIFRRTKDGAGWKRGLAFFGFILRIFAFGAALTAAIVMGTTDETLPFFTHYYQFHAEFSDLPALLFFVVGNAIAAGHLVFSLPLSIITICRPQAVGPWLLLLISDTVMVALTAAAASAAAAIVALAHSGSEKANWVAICLRFDGFCQQISGAVVVSFVAVVLLMVLVVISALAMRKR
ncbi:casparian strip membrane protein 2 [Phoenix dactylifera]|uniref:CASP-like protein n=1 Tax=Phoenix dactylifera TaxID=42345 RepID=A0A8B7CTF2_PHODC|nr:casparian strip membrane protein 2 [Phoenix dactylifera]